MNYEAKLVADDYHRIAVWWLVREARKSNFKAMRVIWGDETSAIYQVVLTDKSFVRFSYDEKDLYTGKPRHFEYDIPLQESSCHFGGRRHWFMCSMVRNGNFCGKWVGVLYKCGDYFACRHCFNLTYRSRNDNRRSKFYVTLRFLDTSAKIKTLENEIKSRRVYAGKLTKKARRLQHYFDASNAAAREMRTIENYAQK